MTPHERTLYLSYIRSFSDEVLQLEADDAFINLVSDPDESIHYIMCVEEQKRRNYGQYERLPVARLLEATL